MAAVRDGAQERPGSPCVAWRVATATRRILSRLDGRFSKNGSSHLLLPSLLQAFQQLTETNAIAFQLQEACQVYSQEQHMTNLERLLCIAVMFA